MIIIPDVHGRDFWEKIVHDHENEFIIFLGDYHDPYSYEGITQKESIKNFKKILEFKKAHMDNVVLLIGNHDAHYLNQNVAGSRYDYTNEKELQSLFINNSELFQMCFIHGAIHGAYNDMPILFSHAGIHNQWIKLNSNIFPQGTVDVDGLVDHINKLFQEDNQDFMNSLGQVSHLRGGLFEYGSMVWADVNEHTYYKDYIKGYYQIFGHSQQEEHPIITTKFACLDCRKGFILNEEDGSLKQID